MDKDVDAAQPLRRVADGRFKNAIIADGEIASQVPQLRQERAVAYELSLADSIEEAEASYRKALSVAQPQRARSLELRAAVSLTKLLKARGRVEEARPLLAAILGSFTEGFDTADLKEATQLLEKI